MARRPFDPAEHGWKRTEYVQGDVLDRAAVDAFVKGADVVVHLAFIIFGGLEESRSINLEGSRNVFEATVAAGAKRLVYASSVAAYGFHDDNPELLTEDIPPRGTDAFYYSAQKAELESVLAGTLSGGATDAYVFRPCIVAGPESLLLIENIPYVQISGKLPGGGAPALRPPADPQASASRIRACRSSSCTPTTWRPRCAVRCSGAASRASTTSPADGELTMRDLADRAGLVLASRCPSWRSTRPPSWWRACRSCHPRGVARVIPHARAHGHGQGQARAALAPAQGRARDAGRDGGRRASGATHRLIPELRQFCERFDRSVRKNSRAVHPQLRNRRSVPMSDLGGNRR